MKNSLFGTKIQNNEMPNLTDGQTYKKKNSPAHWNANDTTRIMSYRSKWTFSKQFPRKEKRWNLRLHFWIFLRWTLWPHLFVRQEAACQMWSCIHACSVPADAERDGRPRYNSVGISAFEHTSLYFNFFQKKNKYYLKMVASYWGAHIRHRFLWMQIFRLSASVMFFFFF